MPDSATANLLPTQTSPDPEMPPQKPLAGGGGGRLNLKKPLTDKQRAAAEQRLSHLRAHLILRSLESPAAGARARGPLQEAALDALGLLNFFRLDLRSDAPRPDLIARLVAYYDPACERSFVHGVRVALSRHDLARALDLPPKPVSAAPAPAYVDPAALVSAVMQLLHDCILLPFQGDDMCILPPEVAAAEQAVREGSAHRVDWAGLMWALVEKEMLELPKRNDGMCYYWPHLQRLIFYQQPHLLELVDEGGSGDPVLEVSAKGDGDVDVKNKSLVEMEPGDGDTDNNVRNKSLKESELGNAGARNDGLDELELGDAVTRSKVIEELSLGNADAMNNSIQEPDLLPGIHTRCGEFTLNLVENSVKAICNHCKAQLVSGNTMRTSDLKYHINACPAFRSSKRRRTSGTPKAGISNFDQEQSREDLARMIVCHNYPFAMTEHYYTRRFITRLQPFFKLGHRNSVIEDCLKLYEVEKDKLYGILNQNASRVSITSDLWTATEMSCYLSMTVHYIDADWKLHKKVIAFVNIKGPHNGENVGSKLIKRLYDWNLNKKLFSFVLDNSSVNNVVIQDILEVLSPKKVLRLNGDLFHVRCAAHILNLIVQDGLKSIQNVIENVRNSMEYVKGSTLRKEKFRFIADQVNAPKVSLVADVPTRWNSTYNMLETAQKFREAFTRMGEHDSEYKFAPSDDDWKHVSIVTNCLKVFYDVTKRVSSTKYPTASLYFNDFCGIYLLLRKWKVSDNNFIAAMAKPMIEKFENYWGIANKLLTFATILDPRYKLKSIEYYFGLLYGELEAEIKVQAIKRGFSDLFDEYASEATESPPAANSCRNFEAEANLVESSMSLSATRLGLSRFIHESYSSQHKRSELKVYLDEPTHPEKDTDVFDIIAWWKLHGPKYPIISLMARDILSVPLCTVASESVFNTAGLIIDKNRCSLLPETVEALMCTQDWLRGAIPDESSMASGAIFPTPTS